MSQGIQESMNNVSHSVQDAVQVAAPTDVFEREDEYLLVADFPGVSADSLHVEVREHDLALEGRAGPASNSGPSGSSVVYARRFRIPATVDRGQIKAELSSGVLRVHMGKAETARPRRIPVGRAPVVARSIGGE